MKQRQRVVFPQPLGPVKMTKSPFSMVNSTISMEGFVAPGYVYVSPLVSMMAKVLSAKLLQVFLHLRVATQIKVR